MKKIIDTITMLTRRFGDLMSSNASFSIGKMKFKWSVVIPMVILLCIVNYFMMHNSSSGIQVIEGLENNDDNEKPALTMQQCIDKINDDKNIEDKDKDEKTKDCMQNNTKLFKEQKEKEIEKKKKQYEKFKDEYNERLKAIINFEKSSSLYDSVIKPYPQHYLPMIPLMDEGYNIAKKQLGGSGIKSKGSSMFG